MRCRTEARPTSSSSSPSITTTMLRKIVPTVTTLLFLWRIGSMSAANAFVTTSIRRPPPPSFQLAKKSLVSPNYRSPPEATAKALAVSSHEDATAEGRLKESAARRTMLLVWCSMAVAVGILLSLPEPSNALAVQQVSPALLSSELPTIVTLGSTASATTMVSSAATIVSSPTSAIDWDGVLKNASKKALGGGKAGAYAAVVQVFSLMWLRTSMNRQYRYGGDLQSSLKALWEEGGIPRLYQGLPFALVQGPLTRFGDTAANVGILALLDTIPETQSLPLPAKTAVGSIVAGTWRILLMPIDASKTAMQVEGAIGLENLWKIALQEGPGILYQGAVAQAAATAVGHFPWYLTYNFLNDQLPTVSDLSATAAATENTVLFWSLARSAFLGLCSSCVSDVCSNSLRVIKTTKQTARLGNNNSKPQQQSQEGGGTTTTNKNSNTAENTADVTSNKDLSYTDIVKGIIETDGLQGLFGRGLKTRLLTNAIQGSVFSVLWRYFQQTGSGSP